MTLCKHRLNLLHLPNKTLCSNDTNTLKLIQEEYGPTKELVRTCEEDVELAKCEGSCVSSTQPSAMER